MSPKFAGCYKLRSLQSFTILNLYRCTGQECNEGEHYIDKGFIYPSSFQFIHIKMCFEYRKQPLYRTALVVKFVPVVSIPVWAAKQPGCFLNGNSFGITIRIVTTTFIPAINFLAAGLGTTEFVEQFFLFRSTVGHRVSCRADRGAVFCELG